jgi:hypothetical protein
MRKKKQPKRVLNCRQCGAAVDLRIDGWVINGRKEFLCGLECFDKRWRKPEKREISWDDI